MILKSRVLFSVLFILSLFSTINLGYSMTKDQNGDVKMTQEEYQAALKKQDKIHGFIRTARAFEQKGQHERALENYLKAYEINQCASLVAVCRGALADNYEAMGRYEQALEHVNWFLEGLNPEEPLYKKMVEAKSRLTKKIEEHGVWDSKQDPVVPRFKESFEKASRAEQSETLKTFGGVGVWEDFKDAMAAEHAGDFSKARQIYEDLLAKKSEIESQMSVAGWAMLYPAIQRTSEFLQDKGREKEALEWIKKNLLSPDGKYHASLSKLQPEVIAHIKERIEAYKL